MNKQQLRHQDGTCGILAAHSAEDHRASDRIRGVVRGRIQEPSTGCWYKDGYAPFQLRDAMRWLERGWPGYTPEAQAYEMATREEQAK